MADGLAPYADGGSLGRLRQIIDNTYLKKADAPDVSGIKDDLTSVQEALDKIKVMTSEQLNAAIQKAIDEYKAQAQTQGIDLNDTAFLNGGGVTILVSRILEILAQEKEGLQTAEEVTAAIQKAISPIETELESKMTVLPAIDLGTLKNGDEVTLSNIGVGELQIYTFRLPPMSATMVTKVSIVYPSGGEYLNENGNHYSGGEIREFTNMSWNVVTRTIACFRLM